jgi:hypothetical protein
MDGEKRLGIGNAPRIVEELLKKLNGWKAGESRGSETPHYRSGDEY